jgi:hypothetical protein
LKGPRWDIGVGEGTGQYCEIRVLVSVGTEKCKVSVEPMQVGQVHIEVTQHGEAGKIAGDVVAHLVGEAISDFRKSGSLD